MESELTTTAPQEIIDRIHAEQPQVDWEGRRTNGHSMGGSLDTETQATRANRAPAPPPPPKPDIKPPPSRNDLQPAPPPSRNDLPPVQPDPTTTRTDIRTGSGYSPAVQPPPPARPRWQPEPEQAEGIADRLNGTHQALAPLTPKPGQPPVGQPPIPPPPRRPMSRPAEGVTDQFDVVEDDYGLRTDLDEQDLDDTGYDYDDGLEYLDGDLDELDEEEPELLSGRDLTEEPEEDESSELSPGRQWLAVGAQLALGVVGGAAVWLLFNWLWNQLPAVALGAALIVTAGLVWIVRNIRKAEDMQSTVLAVLVGLVVTVSPAMLLLLSR